MSFVGPSLHTAQGVRDLVLTLFRNSKERPDGPYAYVSFDALTKFNERIEKDACMPFLKFQRRPERVSIRDVPEDVREAWQQLNTRGTGLERGFRAPRDVLSKALCMWMVAVDRLEKKTRGEVVITNADDFAEYDLVIDSAAHRVADLVGVDASVDEVRAAAAVASAIGERILTQHFGVPPTSTNIDAAIAAAPDPAMLEAAAGAEVVAQQIKGFRIFEHRDAQPANADDGAGPSGVAAPRTKAEQQQQAGGDGTMAPGCSKCRYSKNGCRACMGSAFRGLSKTRKAR